MSPANPFGFPMGGVITSSSSGAPMQMAGTPMQHMLGQGSGWRFAGPSQQIIAQGRGFVGGAIPQGSGLVPYDSMMARQWRGEFSNRVPKNIPLPRDIPLPELPQSEMAKGANAKKITMKGALEGARKGVWRIVKIAGNPYVLTAGGMLLAIRRGQKVSADKHPFMAPGNYYLNW